jgi:hypothetical protein
VVWEERWFLGIDDERVVGVDETVESVCAIWNWLLPFLAAEVE